MKSNILLETIIVSSLCLSAFSGIAQRSAGASVGTGGSGGSVNAGASAATGNGSVRAGAQQQLQPGQPNISVSGSGDINSSPSTQPQNPQQFSGTNTSPGTTTAPGQTNADASSPGQPVSPTSRPGSTNTVYATNSAAATNMAAGPQHDQAITEQDRAMLMQMRQAVFQGQPMTGWMHSIHFILKDGVVRIVGTVPSAAERQRIEAIVTQIPGVLKVYDVIAVNASAGADAGAANGSGNADLQSAPPRSLPPTTVLIPTNTPGPAGAASPQPK